METDCFWKFFKTTENCRGFSWVFLMKYFIVCEIFVWKESFLNFLIRVLWMEGIWKQFWTEVKLAKFQRHAGINKPCCGLSLTLEKKPRTNFGNLKSYDFFFQWNPGVLYLWHWEWHSLCLWVWNIVFSKVPDWWLKIEFALKILSWNLERGRKESLYQQSQWNYFLFSEYHEICATSADPASAKLSAYFQLL